jgi:hypothetical protein
MRQLVIGMGNPQVSLTRPVPVPALGFTHKPMGLPVKTSQEHPNQTRIQQVMIENVFFNHFDHNSLNS